MNGIVVMFSGGRRYLHTPARKPFKKRFGGKYLYANLCNR
jgi:hypothetical protein